LAAAVINRYTFAGLGAVLAVCLVGTVAFLLANPPASTPSSPPPGDAAQPAPQSPLQAAAKAAGCTLQDPPDEGNAHVARQVTAADYETNPPTSGMHAPVWAQDGIYAPGKTPDLGTLVHTLEHGRIDVQYKPGTPAATIKQLTAWVKSEDRAYHMLLFENTTQMPYAVAATAWTHLIGCPRMNDKVIAALEHFRAQYIDQGPEVVP
jgi:Protein of unknown function (DUF3105)